MLQQHAATRLRRRCPPTLRQDEESSEPEAAAKAYRDFGLLFAICGERSSTDVGTEMTLDDAIVDVVAAEHISMEKDDMDDELMTMEEQNRKSYKMNSLLEKQGNKWLRGC